MCMSVLPTCMSVYHMQTPAEARQERQIQCNWSFRCLQAPIQLLGIEPQSSLEELPILTAELPLQLHDLSF